MNRPSRFKTRGSKTRCLKTRRARAGNCRNWLVPSWVRRAVMAENLDKLWLELRRHASVETDPQKLWQLAAELERRKQLEVSSTQQNVSIRKLGSTHVTANDAPT